MLSGTCSSCHRVTTLIEGPLTLGTPSPPARVPPGEPRGAPSAPLECAECGSPLTVAAQPDGSIEVSCSECETVSRFVPEDHRPSSSRGREPERDRRTPGRTRDEGPGRSRPCRQCGAPLTFTTDENGQLTGECRQCGNRFTLPPRKPGFSRGQGSQGRFAPRGPPRYRRGPGGWQRERYPSSRREFRPSEEEGTSDRRPRRRPRRRE